MCRITGFWDFKASPTYDRAEVLQRMRDTMQYGGPDDAGVYLDTAVALGHRRLSILDLSKAGHQPMQWQKYVIVYNGEIYNFKEIRKTLDKKGYTFVTNTDTEVILKAFHEWQLAAVERFHGMFAFAIWDTVERKLTLCRDRMGVKPLYWYWKDDLFMFSSELKAFHEHPHFDKTIDPKAVSLFLQQGNIHHPFCIFKHVRKLQAGTFLDISPNGHITDYQYWNLNNLYHHSNGKHYSEPALLEQCEHLLAESFQRRMVSDVPVGIFLSGGIDSSLVTAILQKQTNQQLQTFTIGFEQPEFNEAPHAKAIAEHLGTDHTEYYCTEAGFLEVLSQWTEMYDEPFGDSSGIPTHIVAKLAREKVKVSLSADGADESFGGYTKYEATQSFYPKLKPLPYPAKVIMQKGLQLIHPEKLEKRLAHFPFLARYTNLGNKFYKFRNVVTAQDAIDFFLRSSMYVSQPEVEAAAKDFQARYAGDTAYADERLVGFLGLIDMQTYLEGDILTKIDRATMQTALEGREPFLDQEIITFGLQLPDTYKMRNGQSKYLLRQLLYQHVPRELIDRPKQGFAVPIGKWLRQNFKEELVALQTDTAFFEHMGLNHAFCRQCITAFSSQNDYANEYFIWFLFVLHRWYQRWHV